MAEKKMFYCTVRARFKGEHGDSARIKVVILATSAQEALELLNKKYEKRIAYYKENAKEVYIGNPWEIEDGFFDFH